MALGAIRDKYIRQPRRGGMNENHMQTSYTLYNKSVLVERCCASLLSTVHTAKRAEVEYNDTSLSTTPSSTPSNNLLETDVSLLDKVRKHARAMLDQHAG